MNDADDHPASRQRYHHGALRAALLEAAEAELSAAGVEAFSLRRVARRAAVSHAAPAHHFSDTQGLLTALAAEGYRRLLDAMQEAERGDAPSEDRILDAGLGYVGFAMRNPALFRLVFGSDRPDKSDPELAAAAAAAFAHLADLVAEMTGEPSRLVSDATEDTIAIWSVSHGLADLMCSGRLKPLQDLSEEERAPVIRAMLRRALRAAPHDGR